MTVLPSPQSYRNEEEREENVTILLSAVGVFRHVFACQTGNTGQSTGKDFQKAHPDLKAK